MRIPAIPCGTDSDAIWTLFESNMCTRQKLTNLITSPENYQCKTVVYKGRSETYFKSSYIYIYIYIYRGSPNGYGANGSTIIFKMETGIVDLGACLGCVSFSKMHLLWRMLWELRGAWYPTRAGPCPGPKLMAQSMGPAHGPWPKGSGPWALSIGMAHGSWPAMGQCFPTMGVAAPQQVCRT